jgi:hypothetical protein
VPGLGDILVQHGVIDQQQLATAEAHQSKQGGSLAKSLFELGMATEGQLMQALATSLGMEYVDVSAGSVDRNVVAMLSQQTAEELTVLPVRFGGADDVIVAVAEPVNDEVLQRLASELGTTVTPGADLAPVARRGDPGAGARHAGRAGADPGPRGARAGARRGRGQQRAGRGGWWSATTARPRNAFVAAARPGAR